MNRPTMLQRLTDPTIHWDMLVIGGGATGLGIAVDAATRGYSVALIERDDFGSATSSRSTKLIHGGVRYLRQGRISLVRESLQERATLLRNAPHLVRPLPILLPCYKRFERLYYAAGLKLYDLLAKGTGFNSSRLLSQHAALEHITTIQPQNLRGGVLYHDGQFDDARLLIDLALTASAHGAAVVNQTEAIGFLKDSAGSIAGVIAEDRELHTRHEIRARIVINAAGPFCDELRRLDRADRKPILALSRGSHITLNKSFLPGNTALLVPKTADGRIMFAIPWLGRTIIGTTDLPAESPTTEPRATPQEIESILATAAQYLNPAPTTEDIRSVFSGLRPLAKPEHAEKTAVISREHTIELSDSGLLTICGGKWTTYRNMAQLTVTRAAQAAGLAPRQCVTQNLRLNVPDTSRPPDHRLTPYGIHAEQIESLERLDPTLAQPLHPDLDITGSQIVWAARHEMARRLEDALSRRTRALLLDAELASEIAPKAAQLMAKELGHDKSWAHQQTKSFAKLARNYTTSAP